MKAIEFINNLEQFRLYPQYKGDSHCTKPTVQRRLALSGKICFNSLWLVTNVTGQGNGLRSRIVREKRAGPGITVKAKNKK